MSLLLPETETNTGNAPLVLHLRPVIEMTEEQFFEFCQLNRNLRLERNAHGELIAMSPAGFESDDQEAEIVMQLRQWAKRQGNGTAPNSSTGYLLPNGSVRAPDASWVSHVRLSRVSAAERLKFPPLSPEFVVELRSPSDRLTDLQAKMQEYMENGVLLGLLIDPAAKQVHLYRPQQPVQLFTAVEKVSCEPELPGFELLVREIW
jgi:Uma2 family endonuclease